MKESGLSFLVIGAGAVGGITAAFLKKAGYNVEIVCKYDDYARLILNEGLEVTGSAGYCKVKMVAHASISSVTEKKDIILLATKATDMIDAALAVKNVLKKDGYLISLQNGFCEDDLASVLGEDRIIGCVTGWGATMESHGRLVMTSKGNFILGYPAKDPDSFLSSLAEILSSVVPVEITDNIRGHLYSKLIINSCITSLGAVCGLYLGKMLLIPKARRIFIEIISEAMEVAGKMNINVEVFGGRLNFKEFLEGTGIISDIRRHIVLIVIGMKYRRLKSSSLQSLERGKPTEIDYLNGFIVRNGEKLNISVPVNSGMVSMIHEIQLKKRTISADNFNDTFFDRFN